MAVSIKPTASAMNRGRGSCGKAQGPFKNPPVYRPEVRSKKMELIARDICKRFGEKEVLRGASFTFEKGRIYGLLGRNGAGKTTLFNCMNEDVKADGGSFEIAGDDGRRRLRVGLALLRANP